MWIIEDIASAIWKFFTQTFAQIFLAGFSKVMGWISIITGPMWSDPLIDGLLTFATRTAWAIFMMTLIIVLLDIHEDIAADKKVYMSTVVSTILKTMLFVIAAPAMGRYSLEAVNILIKTLDFGEAFIDYDQIGTLVGFGILEGLVAFIACTVFLVMSLKQFGVMLLQIVTYVLYVPSILRGDTTAMGGWIRQTIAIALTYFFQYLMFYLGLYFWVKLNLLTAFGLWLSMGMVTRILDKYGLSSGTGGGLASATSVALQSFKAVAT